MEEVKEELEKENEELENVEVNEEAIKEIKKKKIIRTAIGGLLAIGGIFLAISIGHKKPQFEEVHESTSIEYEMPNYQSSNDDSKDDKQEEISNENDDETKLKNLGDFRLDVDLSQCSTEVEAFETIAETYNLEFHHLDQDMLPCLDYYMENEKLTGSRINMYLFEDAIKDMICQDKYAISPICDFSLESDYTFEEPYVEAFFEDGFGMDYGDVEVKKMPDDFKEIVNCAKIINAYKNSGLANEDVLDKAYRGLCAKTIQVIINDAQGKYDASEFEFKLPELTNQNDTEDSYSGEENYEYDSNEYSAFEIELNANDEVPHKLVRA